MTTLFKMTALLLTATKILKRDLENNLNEIVTVMGTNKNKNHKSLLLEATFIKLELAALTRSSVCLSLVESYAALADLRSSFENFSEKYFT